MFQGVKTTYSENTDHIIDLSKGLKYLKERNDGVGLLKKIGMNGLVAKATKINWTETSFAVRKETINVDNVATDITVADFGTSMSAHHILGLEQVIS